MNLRNLDPDLCSCRSKPLVQLIASWAKRAQSRIASALDGGRAVNLAKVRHEAQMVASIARKGPAAFAAQNVGYGHFCDECPYRKRNPLQETLAVDLPDRRR